MTAWIGKAVAAIGVIHVVFGAIVFRKTFVQLGREGFWNTINGQPDRELAFWFVFFGVLAIILGLLTDWCERYFQQLPKFLGWSLLAVTVICCVLMPISGGWLILIPTVGAILRSARHTDTKIT